MQIRTDLALESRECSGAPEGVTMRTRRWGAVTETQVTVESEEAAKTLCKSCGRYVTLFVDDLLHAGTQVARALSQALADTLSDMLPPFGDLLVVGLGNRRITADALGSRVLESLLITRHLKDMTDETIKGRLRGVCAVAPGVLGVTGMETAEVIHGVVDRVRPAAVIAIDALAARESARICTTVQITDTGIRPGSGVGNHRVGLTKETLGVPVVAVGVPMVVYASVIARDALSMMLSDVGLEEEAHEDAMDALVMKLTEHGLGDMVVTPREVDDLVGKVAEILALGLNLALQPRLSGEEITMLSHDTL